MGGGGASDTAAAPQRRRPPGGQGPKGGWKRGPGGGGGGGKDGRGQQHHQQRHQHQQQSPPSALSLAASSATGAAAGSGGGVALLLALDHRAVRWWEMEALLVQQHGQPAGKQQQKKTNKKKNKLGSGQQNPTTSPGCPSPKEGEAVLAAAVTAMEARRRARGLDQDAKWTEKVLRQGTLSDKVAALTLLVQEAPLLRLRTLDALLALAAKADRRCSQMALEAGKDLLEHNLLPPDRKLRAWGKQPGWGELEGQPPALREAVLALRAFEEQLKQRVASVVARLERASHDTVDNFKRFAMSVAGELLQARPEQEERLLALLVNKLGDADRKNKAAPHAAHLLRRVLRAHPAMKAVVAREVQQLLHRPNLQPRGLYNGITFLDQLYLSKGQDGPLARQLLQTYFGLFDRALKAGDLSGKMLSALLTGVNRAYPYLDAADRRMEGEGAGPLAAHMEDLFRTVHQSSFKTSVQALMLLHQVVVGSSSTTTSGGRGAPTPSSSSSSAVGDGKGTRAGLEARFYRALYDKLKAPEMLSTASPVLFLNLVYKAMKADRDEARVAAFAKRLLGAAALQGSAALAAGVVFLLSEVTKAQPALRRALLEPAQAGEREGYDPTKREPSFAFAPNNGGAAAGEEEGKPHLWELALLRLHFHPSVRHFCASLLSPEHGHRVTYAGDPLADFATMAFLDRFSYKNPKQQRRAAGAEGEEGEREAGEVAAHNLGAGALANRKQALAAAAAAPVVNSAEFLALAPQDLGPDQLFFHRFFREKAERDRRLGRGSKGRGDEEEEEDGSDGSGSEEEDSDGGGGSDEDGSGSEDGSEEGSDAEEAEIDAYADKLAQSLMRNHGQVDFSDEDPDTEDWGDLADDASGSGSGSDDDEEGEGEDEGGGGDVDAFMDDDDDDGGSEEEEGDEDGSEGSEEDWMAGAADEASDESEEEEEEEAGAAVGGRKRGHSGSDSGEEAAEVAKPAKKGKGGGGGGGGGLSAFASSDEYAALIDQEFSKFREAEEAGAGSTGGAAGGGGKGKGERAQQRRGTGGKKKQQGRR